MTRWFGLLLLMVGLGLVWLGCDEEDDTDTDPGDGVLDLADPSFVITVADAAALAGQSNVVFVDVRDAETYGAGHIAGAVNIPWGALADMSGQPGDAGFAVAVSIDLLAATLGAAGITIDSTVVVYGGAAVEGWGDDGRIVWQLQAAGISGAKILNGGIPAWQASGHPVSADPVTPTPVALSLTAYDPSFVADTAWMEANYQTAKVIDSRALVEFNGAQDFGEARGGHIPGAIHLEFSNVYNPNGLLKSQAELEALFTSAGLAKTDSIATYCTAGIRSGLLAVVLRAAGYTNTRNYDESFYWWAANPDLPLE